MPTRDGKIPEFARENTTSRPLNNSLLKRLWTCHKTHYVMMMMMMMMVMFIDDHDDDNGGGDEDDNDDDDHNDDNDGYMYLYCT
jgi:hypothetical protein